MKRVVKALCLFLCAVLICPALLSGCGGYKSKYDAVMEYNGIKLTEEFYNYWLSTFKRNILASYSDAEDTPEFWGQKYDDERTVEDYFTELLNNKIMTYLVAQDLYKKNSLKLPSSIKKAVEADINEKIDFYGGRGSLNSTLSDMMLNIDALEEIYLWEEKYDFVYSYLFGEGGPLEITDKDLIDYYEKTYYKIKYVVFYTTDIKTDENGNYVYDESGEPVSEELTPEEMAEKLATIEKFEGRMNGGESFDELIKAYSEFDTSSYPDGFFISENDLDIWGPDIFKAVKNAEVDSVTRIEEEAAIFFVKKIPLTSFEALTDADITQLTNIKFTENATNKISSDFFNELIGRVKINKDVIGRYKLSEISPNPHYSI